MGVSAYALISLFEAREYPGLASVADSEDSLLEALIDGATFAIESYCGNAFVQRAFTEDYSYDEIRQNSRNAETIWLRRYPIVSVTSITDPAGNTVAATDYWIDKPKGALRTTGRWQIPQNSNGYQTYWTIVYTAGRFATTAAVDGILKLACKIAVANMYKHPDADVVEKAVGDLRIRYNEKTEGADLPSRVLALIASYKSRMV